MAGVLVLQPQRIVANPGIPAVAHAKITNTGAIVEEFAVEVLGPAAGWVEASPPRISLFPGADGMVELHVRPPRSPEVEAGEVPIGVRITPAQSPTETVVEEAIIDVAPFVEVEARITPRSSEGKRFGRHEVVLTSSGNAPADVGIEVIDPDDVLAFKVSQDRVTVHPGGTEVIPVRAASKKRHLTGGARSCPFQVRVEVPGAPMPTMLDATFAQKSGMPRWVVPVMALGVGALALFLLLPKATGGSGLLSLASNAAVTTTTAAPEGEGDGAGGAAEGEADSSATSDAEAAGGDAEPSQSGGERPLEQVDTSGASDDVASEIGTRTPRTTVADSNETVAPPETTSNGSPAPTTTAPSAYKAWIGEWKNKNSSTSSQTRFTVHDDGSRLVFNGFGACGGGECVWENYNPPHSSGYVSYTAGASSVVEIVYDFGFKKTYQRIERTSPKDVTVQSTHKYSDGRQDLFTTEHFYKAS